MLRGGIAPTPAIVEGAATLVGTEDSLTFAVSEQPDRQYPFIAVPVRQLTTQQQAALNAFLGTTTVDSGDELPATALPYKAFVLTAQDGNHAPGVYRAADVPGGGLVNMTQGTIRLGLWGTDGLAMTSEQGLAEEVTFFGWFDAGPDSFNVRINTSVSHGPGLTTVFMGVPGGTLHQIAQYQIETEDRDPSGQWVLERIVSREGYAPNVPYAVRIQSQQPVFTGETLGWGPVSVADSPDADEWLAILDPSFIGTLGLNQVGMWQKADNLQINGEEHRIWRTANAVSPAVMSGTTWTVN